MEQTVQKSNRHRSQQILLILIAMLVVLLIAVIIVALVAAPHSDDPGESTGNTANSGIGTTPTVTTGPIVIGDLTLVTPEGTDYITLEKEVTFQGSADPLGGLTVNGSEVALSDDGSFAHTVTLDVGVNTITLSYDGEETIYHIEYRHGLQYFTPTETVYGCGATVQISAAIREGASLSVTLDGNTVKMKKAVEQLGAGLEEGFILYTGTYKLPHTNTEDVNLGAITYTVTCDGITETFTSGEIICQKSGDVLKSDPSVTPNYGEYIDVGSGYIVEVLNNSAETFLSTTADKSMPNLNYLPKGTLDYGSVVDIDGKNPLVQLRCGRQVYLKAIRNYPPSGHRSPVVDCYKGTLPDHNELGFAQLQQDENYTIMVLDSMWKAPFLLDLLPQRYNQERYYIFDIDTFTAEYVEITFCYATVFEGEVTIPGDNPLFSHAELTRNESDCTLRLYLKEKGRFFGWDAYYNENDQLCFRFINPKSAQSTTTNAYGADLTGIRIMIDVGHGGEDGGAQPSGCPVDEAALNLQLSLKLCAELESMGATVIMNRTTDVSVSIQERIGFLKEQAPDLCIAIHQNSGTSTSFNGGWICYYSPYSKRVAELIYAETKAAGIYNKTVLDWDNTKYYVNRETVCPVILMENGFMTNTADLETMMDEAVQLQKAQAIARGVARYFLTIH